MKKAARKTVKWPGLSREPEGPGTLATPSDLEHETGLPRSPVPYAGPDCLSSAEFETLAQRGNLPKRRDRRHHVARCARCAAFVRQFANEDQLSILFEIADGYGFVEVDESDMPLAAAELADVDEEVLSELFHRSR